MEKRTQTTKHQSFNFRYRSEGFLFLDNLTTLLETGMDMLSAINSLREESRSSHMGKVLETMVEEIESGSSFWKAIQNTEIFPDRIVMLIKIGEESGRLTENLLMISLQQQKDNEFNSKLHSALIYPSIVVMLIIIVGGVVALFILPRLAGVFTSLNIDLPLSTQIMVAVGLFLERYGLVVLPLTLTIIALGVYLLFYYDRTKIIGEKILLNIPGIKTVIQQVEISRFGYLLGGILETGIPVVTGINSLKEATTVVTYKKFYEQLSASIEEGNSFHKSFHNIKLTDKLIPRPIQQMLAAAEQSGRIPETLKKIGEVYERKADVASKNITVAIEPILLIIIGIGVFLVAIAVILPIYSLIGNLSSVTGN